MTTFLSNKVNLAILLLVILVLIIGILWVMTMNVGNIEIAGSSIMRYCVSSGSVCTGTG